MKTAELLRVVVPCLYRKDKVFSRLSDQFGQTSRLRWSYFRVPQQGAGPVELTIDGPLGKALQAGIRPLLIDTGAETSVFPAGTGDYFTFSRLPLAGDIDYGVDPEKCAVSATGHGIWGRRLTIWIVIHSGELRRNDGVHLMVKGWERADGRIDEHGNFVEKKLQSGPPRNTQEAALFGLKGGLDRLRGFAYIDTGCSVLIR